jgi:hypothetical protein
MDERKKDDDYDETRLIIRRRFLRLLRIVDHVSWIVEGCAR